MAKKRKQHHLSQAEVWDDRGLINSWNQAYEEYQLYHSIHARGENVDDVLAAAEEVPVVVDGGDATEAAESKATSPATAPAATVVAAPGVLGKWQALDANADVTTGSETGFKKSAAEPVSPIAHACAVRRPLWRKIEAMSHQHHQQQQQQEEQQQQPPQLPPLHANDAVSAAATATANGAPPVASMIHGLIASSLTDESLKNLLMSWYWAGYYTGLREGQLQAVATTAAATTAAAVPAPAE